MKIFNIEKLMKDIQSKQICEFHLNEGQKPFAGILVDQSVHQITPLKEYEKLSHLVCVDIIQSLENIFDISVDNNLFILEKDGIIFIVVKGDFCEGISITLRKSLNRKNWI